MLNNEITTKNAVEHRKNRSHQSVTNCWNSLLAETKDLDVPGKIDDILSEQECDVLKDIIVKFISRSKPENESKVRLYIEGAQMLGKYLNQNFYFQLPYESENLIAWLQRAYRSRKFAIFLNNCESLDNSLSSKVASYVYPLLNRIGIPSCGLCIDVIIGNYGYTPFGIHVDTVGESIINFHLGPAEKIMYTWDSHEYVFAHHGTQNNQNIAPLIPFAKKFVINQGDIFFMPWNNYHVGYSSQISISLCVTLQSHLRDSLVSRVFDYMLADFSKTQKPGILKPENNLSSFYQFNSLNSEVENNRNWNILSFYDAFKSCHQEFKLSLGSNGGLMPVSRSQLEKSANKMTEDDGFENQSFASVDPFKILYIEQDPDVVIIFARGHKIICKNIFGIESIIKSLNDGCTIDFHTEVKNLIPQDCLECVLDLFKELYLLKAIQLKM